ncbi:MULTISPECIES: hypothetical protein [unclassified Rhizobacter]|nr:MULTISPECIES: hypothetical protein [unclassified Rhizobacter]
MKTLIYLLAAMLSGLTGCANLSQSTPVCDPPNIRAELGNSALNCKPT